MNSNLGSTNEQKLVVQRKLHLRLTIKQIILLVIALGLIILSFIYVGFIYAPRGFIIFNNNMSDLFTFSADGANINYPEWNLWNLSFYLLALTIKSVLLGTFLGVVLAVFTGILANKKLKLFIITPIVKLLVFVLRALPAIVLLTLFQNDLSKDVALLVMLFWFSWLWNHKYFVEMLENVDYYGYTQLRLQGENHLFAIRKQIWPQISSRLIALSLFSFESNMRWSTLLGSLGLLGIGQLFVLAQDNSYESMGIPLIVIIGFMLIFELIVFLIRKYLLTTQSKPVTSLERGNFFKQRNLAQTIAGWIVVLVFFAGLIAVIVTTSWESGSSGFATPFINSFFNPAWNELVVGLSNTNIGWGIIELLLQSVVIVSLAFVLVIFLVLLSARKLLGKWGWIGISLTTFLRAIPSVALFFILLPIYNSPGSAICLALAINGGTVVAKQLNDAIDKMKVSIIASLKAQGKGFLKIYVSYVLPTISNDLLVQMAFAFESGIRELINYGAWGVSLIGTKISLLIQRSQYSGMAAYAWVGYFVILFAFMISSFVRFKFIEHNSIIGWFNLFKQKFQSFFNLRFFKKRVRINH